MSKGFAYVNLEGGVAFKARRLVIHAQTERRANFDNLRSRIVKIAARIRVHLDWL